MIVAGTVEIMLSCLSFFQFHVSQEKSGCDFRRRDVGGDGDGRPGHVLPAVVAAVEGVRRVRECVSVMYGWCWRAGQGPVG